MAYLPLLTEKQTFWTSAGAIASGYKLFIYLAGTTTKADTFQETTGTANTNPVVLNSRGEVPYGVYVAAGSTYKLVLAPSTDSDPPVAPVWTRDNLSATNDTTVTVDQWQASGFTPTYVSATSFTVTGDRTSTFQVGRRIKSTNTGGTIYSTITVSAYSSVTTVTVVNDSGTLDSGISAVSVGLLTPTNPSLFMFNNSNFKYSPVATVRTASFPDYAVRLGNLPAGIGPLPYAGSTIPTGWLECDGTAVSRTTYAALFAAISTTWGTGDGSTTFNLPDCRGRVPLGAGTGTNFESFTNTAITTGTDSITVASNVDKWITGMQVVFTTPGTAPTTNPANLLDTGDTVYVVRIDATTIKFATTLANAVAGTVIDITAAGSGTFTITQTLGARTLGVSGGEATHALVISELPVHTHTQNSHTHASTITIATATAAATDAMAVGTRVANASTTTQSAAVTNVAATATNQDTGGSTAHNIVPPYITTKMIISY